MHRAVADASFDYAAVLRRCAEGDRKALRQLYDHDAGAMLGIATRILRRRELAEEAVHDAFVQVWRRAASFDASRGAGRAWLFAVVRHRALNILRGTAREELVDDLLVEEADDRPDPEAVVVLMDETSRLRGCLELLEPKRRQGLVLAYTFALSHGEVAARLNVPLGTAKSWIRRAFLQVQECMK